MSGLPQPRPERTIFISIPKQGGKTAWIKQLMSDQQPTPIKDNRPGWIPCQGQVMRKAEWPELFAVIGNQYGGAGEYFHLPDMRIHPCQSLLPLPHDFRVPLGADPQVGDIYAGNIRAIPWPDAKPKDPPGPGQLLADMERECSTQLADLEALHQTERAADKAEIERLTKALHETQAQLGRSMTDHGNERADLIEEAKRLNSLLKSEQAANADLLATANDLATRLADQGSKATRWMVLANRPGGEIRRTEHSTKEYAEREAVAVARRHACEVYVLAMVGRYKGQVVVTDEAGEVQP